MCSLHAKLPAPDGNISEISYPLEAKEFLGSDVVLTVTKKFKVYNIKCLENMAIVDQADAGDNFVCGGRKLVEKEWIYYKYTLGF